MPESIESLSDVAVKFGKFMDEQKLIRRLTGPDRWVFLIPVLPILNEYFSKDAFFREELAGLSLLSKDLLSSLQEVTSFEVDGVRIFDLIKAQRLMYVIHRVRVEKLKQVWKTDLGAAIQSVAAVYEDDTLINFLGYSLPADCAKKILSLLEWNPEVQPYMDVMYQPIIRAAGGKILIAPNVFSVSNLPRNVLQLTQKRIGEKGDGLLAQKLRQELEEKGFRAWEDVAYHYGGKEGDCDVVALKGDHLFVFECKNSLHPCSSAELRTSFDYLLKAKSQLEKFISLWRDPNFRTYLAKRLDVNLELVQTTSTTIVTGNRMFGGLKLGESSVLGFHELANFIRDSRIVILGKEIVWREEGAITPEQLFNFVSTAPWEERMLSAMRREDRITSFGNIEIHVEDYSLNVSDLAKEWGVEPSEELMSLVTDS
jgi:hypothetical protein